MTHVWICNNPVHGKIPIQLIACRKRFHRLNRDDCLLIPSWETWKNGCVKWECTVCPHIQNTYCPNVFDWDLTVEAQSTPCFMQTRTLWKNLISHFSPLPLNFYFAHIHQITRDPNCTFYALCIASQRFQVVLLKIWESIIDTQALNIISIFIWGITPHRPDNLAPQIPSLSVLWSHSGWSPGWADSAWKTALFNEQEGKSEETTGGASD